MNHFLNCLREIRAMASRSVPNCVNRDAIDRTLTKHHVDLAEPVAAPAAVTQSPARYQLVLSETQAHITAEALEFYTRWCIGQFSAPDIVEWRATAKEYRGQRGIDEYTNRRSRDILDELRLALFPELSGPGHSYGVGWNDKAEQQHAQIGYEIYKSILYEFHKGNNNVHSYPNVLHYSNQPVPVFTLVVGKKGGKAR